MKNREALVLYYLMIMVLLMLVVLLFPGILIIIPLILENFTKYFPIVVGVAAGLGTALILLAIKYDEVSMIKIRDDGFILGNKLVEWKDIDDIKLWTETRVDVETEGSPVIGYGMYGYAMPRGVSFEKQRYAVIQIFHKKGVDEAHFQSVEFWKFVKAIIKAAEHSQQISASKKWLQKFKKLEETA